MIYILGGDGFVGSAYVRYCQQNSINYVSINRNNYSQYIGTECDVFINANGNSKKYLAESDELYDFDASVRSVKSSLLDFDYELYIYLSACDVYANLSSSAHTKEDSEIDIVGISKYGFHKFLSELCVKYSSQKWLIFRMGGFVGPNLIKNPIFDIINNKSLWLSLDSRFQFMHTDSAAKIVFSIIDRTIVNEIYNLAGSGVVKLSEISKLANKEMLTENSLETVVYNISIDKLSKIISVPKSYPIVKEFIKNQIDR